MGSCDSYTGLDETSWCHISAKITAADTAVQHQLSNTYMQLQCVCLYQISENFLAKKKSGKKCNFICNIKKKQDILRKTQAGSFK